MPRHFGGTRRIILAGCGLLLISSAAAFARQEISLKRIFLAVAESLTPVVSRYQQTTSSRPLVKLFLSGVIERNGKKIPVENVGAVKPGEVVSFTMNSVNEGSAPARQYRAIGQIPRGAIFIPESALGDRVTRVSYSIDGGQNFSATPMIEAKQSDGTIKKVPAPVSMYTQIRFEWADPLAAGGKFSASYQVRIN